MSEIVRSNGITKSEKYLAQLCDKSFLNLWSYPNIFRDQKSHKGKTEGKEICDLLIVCGPNIIIFSDKSKEMKEIGDFDLEWQRWFRHAILKSKDQILGAERWLTTYPGRLFLDRNCNHPLPIDVPDEKERRIYRVIVALGAGRRCREFFGGGSGSLMICPLIKGEDHLINKPPNRPFAIGDINPEGGFIHVFDDVSLDIVMSELDTITDFVSYLQKKEEFIRSGHLISAAGEEELLAYYLTHMSQNNEHDFVSPSRKEWEHNEYVTLTEDHWTSMSKNPQYIAKKKADKISYLWDSLINEFTKYMIAGTTLTLDGNFDVREHEKGGVRYMALETRVERRFLAASIADAIEKCPSSQRFFRCILPLNKDKKIETAYIFLQLSRPDTEKHPDISYESYRQVRRDTLYAYCMAVKMKNKELKRVVGIATEPPKYCKDSFTSEDLLLLAPEEWTEEMQREASELCREYDILREDRVNYSKYHGKEYPEIIKPSIPALNRKQRRELERKRKKR